MASVRIPGSKSIAQRALLAAALAPGASQLRGLPAGEDVRAAVAWLRALGIGVAESSGEAGGTLVVQGLGGELPVPVPGPGPGVELDVGESGTLARCGTAVLALCGTPGAEYRLGARGSLLRRSHGALWDALGGRILSRGWPTVLRAAPPTGALLLRHPRSSQEVSGLLLALAGCAGPRTLTVEGRIPSRPYVGLTCAVLARFGVQVEVADTPGGERFEVTGALTPASFAIEPDASLAAVALVAACLRGDEVCALGLTRDSAQGDVRIAEYLAAFWCRVRWTPEGLVASGRPTRGVELDLGGEPDLAPVLAVLAAAAATAGHASRLTGLGTLPGKESSRLEVLASGLRACGWNVRADADSLTFAAGEPHTAPVQLEPHGDHRMAFAFALAGLCRPGVSVAQRECTAKSWPSFWEDLELRA